MRFASAAGGPTRWTVELLDGAVAEVWADSYNRQGDHYTFSCLFDLDEGEELPVDAIVVGHTPSDARRFILAVARIPKTAVRLCDDDDDWPAIFG